MEEVFMNTIRQKPPPLPPDPPPPPPLTLFQLNPTLLLNPRYTNHATNQPAGSPNDMPFAPPLCETGPMQTNCRASSSLEANEFMTSTVSQPCSAAQDEKEESVKLTLPPKKKMKKERKEKNRSNPSKASSMPESAAPSNPQTLSGKSKNSRKRTHSTTSSKTLDQASTSTAKGLKPFWNKSTEEWSKRLLSCTETDCVALDSSSLTSSLQRLALNSWFTVNVSQLQPPVVGKKEKEKEEKTAGQETLQMETSSIQTNLQKTSCPLSCLLQAIMEEEAQQTNGGALSNNSNSNNSEIQRKKAKKDNPQPEPNIPMPKTKSKTTTQAKQSNAAKGKKSADEPPVKVSMRDSREVPEGMFLRSRKVRIYPTTNQKKTLNRWFGASRFVYNSCVSLWTKFKEQRKEKKVSLQLLRDMIFRGETKYGIPFDQPEWFKDIRKFHETNKGRKKAFTEQELLQETPAHHVPYDLLDAAVSDFDKALKINRAKVKRSLEEDPSAPFEFEMKPRSKKRQKKETLELTKRTWNNTCGVFTRLFSPKILCSSEPLPESLDRQFFVSRNKLGQYYLCHLRTVGRMDPVQSSENQAQDKPKAVPQQKQKVSKDVRRAKNIQAAARRQQRRTVLREQFGPLPDGMRHCKSQGKKTTTEKSATSKKKRLQRKKEKKRLQKKKEEKADKEGKEPRVHTPHVPFHRVASLDPGMCCFQTIFDSDGLAIQWGLQDMQRIYRLCRHADQLQSWLANDSKQIGPHPYGETSETRKRRRRRVRKAFLRIYARVRNLVDEAHKKLAKFLCDNYAVILLPDFRTSQMVERRKERKLRSKTARQLCTWSHYRFRKLLEAKAAMYPNCRVVICSEAYTSKTCGCCGVLNQKLGGKRVFFCKECLYKADRDISAARNILLRYLTEHVPGHFDHYFHLASH